MLEFTVLSEYLCLVLLILASQRIEDVIGWEVNADATKRGSPPSLVESCILAWVAGRFLLAQADQILNSLIYVR
jgi:hypothetical protein